MINTSAAYKTALANDHRRWKELITITLTDNTVLNLTEADIWAGGLTIKDALCDEEGFNVIGAAVVNEATLTINNIDGTYNGYDFLWATVQIRVGITLPNSTVETFVRGTYTVVEQPDYANASLIELTLFDNMYKLDQTYTTSLTLPQTVGTIVGEICTNCSVTNSTPTFTNSTVSVTLMPDITDYTYREVLAYMCQITGTYARFKPNGDLAISAIDTTNLAKAVANTSGTYHKFNQIYNCNASFDDVVITGVKVLLYEDTGSDLVERTYTSGTSDYCIILEHNPFVKASEGQALATRLGNMLNGVKFRKMEVTHGSDPSIEAGDIAQIIDGRGNKYGILITSTEFNTGDNQHTQCSAETPERNTSQKYSQTTRNYVELRKQAIQNKSQTDLLIQGLDNRINSLGGMYETTEPAPGGGYYYNLHNKPLLADSDVVLRITDEAVAITSNYDDPTPTWYGLTVDGNFIANILAAYQSVIVGLDGGSHTQIDQNSTTFYGAQNDIVGRITNGSSKTISVIEGLLYLYDAEIVVGAENSVSIWCLPSAGYFPLSGEVDGIGFHDYQLSSTESGNISFTANGITFKVSFDYENRVLTGEITSITGNHSTVALQTSYQALQSTPSFLFGYKVVSTGECSFATGSGSEATGNYSFAGGRGAETSGTDSFAFGEWSLASSNHQFVIGKYNVEDTADTYSLIVGKGSADNARSNALTLDWSGNLTVAGDVTSNGINLTQYGTYAMTVLANNSDLNNIITSGFRLISSANSYTHLPSGVTYGLLAVFNGNRSSSQNYEVQTFYAGNKKATYQRIYASSSWSAWDLVSGVVTDDYTVGGVTFTFSRSGNTVTVTSSGTPSSTVATNAYIAQDTIADYYIPSSAIICNVLATTSIGIQMNINTSGVFKWGYASTAFSGSNVRVSMSYPAIGGF